MLENRNWKSTKKYTRPKIFKNI